MTIAWDDFLYKKNNFILIFKSYYFKNMVLIEGFVS